MAYQRVLVSWIGYADLSGMAEELGGKVKESVLDWMERKELLGRGGGPIKTILNHEKFEEVHLLFNYNPKEKKRRDANRLIKDYAQWLGCAPTVQAVNMTTPTDYKAVFDVSDQFLAQLNTQFKGKTYELCIHLSPGTPAMTAIWVLLGKSRYPATFYQSHEKRGAWTEEIPYDLTLDFVPALLRDPDSSLQNLAARSPQEVKGFEDIVGDSKAIRIAVGRAQRAAVRDVPVLILGESGTGKEMFARAIHAASHRKEGPFVAINCAGIPRDLLESELFGHKRGAFTGAIADREGAFENANEGILFLDEIGDCEPSMQVKLLRILQPPPGKGPCHRVFSRLGESKERNSDVRVIAATNQDLLEAINTNRFREDLYYRLAVISLKLPPLRDRKSDIPLIAERLLKQINEGFRFHEPGYKDKSFSVSTISFMKQYSWPGNVRQLYNAIVQAAVMTDAETIKQRDISMVTELHATKGTNPLEHALGEGFNLQKNLNNIQRHFLEKAMTEADGRITKAASLLGLRNYQTLDNQLKQFKLQHLKR